MYASSIARRRGVVAIAIAIAVAVTSGCGNNASNASTAAQVGAVNVSRDAVVGAVDRAVAAGKTQLSREQLTNEHLTTQVKLALYRDEAHKLGVTPTDAARAATRAGFEEQTKANGGLETAAEASGIAKADIGDLVELFTLERLLAAQLIANTPVTDAELDTVRQADPATYADQAHAAHILVKDESTAKDVLAQVKAGGDFTALAAKYSLDPGSKDKGGDLGINPKGTFVPAFDDALFAAKKGDILGPVKTEFGFHIIKVIDVKTFADNKEAMRAGAAPTVGRLRLAGEIRKGPAVTVNTRFGRWDPDKQIVVSTAQGSDEPSTPSASPALVPAG